MFAELVLAAVDTARTLGTRSDLAEFLGPLWETDGRLQPGRSNRPPGKTEGRSHAGHLPRFKDTAVAEENVLNTSQPSCVPKQGWTSADENLPTGTPRTRRHGLAGGGARERGPLGHRTESAHGRRGTRARPTENGGEGISHLGKEAGKNGVPSSPPD